MKKVCVFFANGFEEVEALTPVDYMRRAGLDVITVSCNTDKAVTGSHGVTILADTTAQEIGEGTFDMDAVVIPGGMPGAKNVANCPLAIDTITKINEKKGLVAAICAAPVVVLGKTGVLKGKKYTCYPGMEDSFAQWADADWNTLTENTRYTGDRSVVDGNLITGAGPGAAVNFAVAIVDYLCGKAAAEQLVSSSLLKL